MGIDGIKFVEIGHLLFLSVENVEKIVEKVRANSKPKPNSNTLKKVKDVSQLLKSKQKIDSDKKSQKDRKQTNKKMLF